MSSQGLFADQPLPTLNINPQALQLPQTPLPQQQAPVPAAAAPAPPATYEDQFKAAKVRGMAPPPPKPGDMLNGYQYAGGNVKDPASWKQLQGEAYLSSLPPDRANLARAVLAGNAPYPTSGFKNPQIAQLRSDVFNAEPNFSADTYKQRSDLIKDMTSGKASQVLLALNQAPQHLLTLDNAYDQLNNSDAPQWLNNAATTVEAGLANKRQLAARGQFNTSQPVSTAELATIYKGGPATIPDIEHQRDAFPQGLGATERASSMASVSELLADRLNTFISKWQNGMGTGTRPFPIVSREAANAINTLYTKYHPGSKPPIDLTALPVPSKTGSYAAPVSTATVDHSANVVNQPAPAPQPSQLPRKGATNRVVNWNDL